MKLIYGLALLWPLTVMASEQQNFLTDPVDLRKSNELKPLIQPQYQTGKPYQDLKSIVDKTTECKPRIVGQESQYGLAFPINPEVLKYLFQNSTDKIIFEIAGASGENCQILSYGPAAHIYYNDISPEEVQAFQSQTRKLDSKIASRITSLPGNILEMKEQHSQLQGQIDVFYCRNLIHFLKDQDLQEFFDTIKYFAKEDATLVISGNCSYAYPEFRQVLKTHPHTTQFNNKQIMIYPPNGGVPIGKLGAVCAPTAGDNVDPLVYDKYQIGTFFLGNVISDKEGVRKMGNELLRVYLQALKTQTLPVPVGYFKVLENNTRSFTPRTLSNLLNNQGIECETTFFINGLGHVINLADDVVSNDQYAGESPLFIGAIARIIK